MVSRRTLAIIGASLWGVGCLIGFLAQFYNFFIMPLLSGHFGEILAAEFIAVLLAVPACLVYVWLPVLIDRFEPEPWWALVMTLLWGALAAAGFSMLVNTELASIGHAIGGNVGEDYFGAVVSAPLVEEGSKGIAVLGMFWFMRREFDGIVDGVIYGVFAALGFAMSENVNYYTQGALGMAGGLGHQFLFRGLLGPWGHPLYTAMTGVGVGIARESTKTWVKIVAPICGYFLGVCLHATWNGSGLIGAVIGVDTSWVMLILYFMIMIMFMGIVGFLVLREAKQLRAQLEDEVLIGNISKQQLDVICSPFGRIKARFGRGGSTGVAFVKTAIKLGMAKWHIARATKGQTGTISIGELVPLRQKLMELNRQLGGTI